MTFKKGEGYWTGKKRPKFSQEWIDKIKVNLKSPKKGQITNTGRTWFKKGHKLSKEQRIKAKERWTGKTNPRWKPIGSKRMSHDYVLIKVAEGKWVKEEWLVAKVKIGRKLYRDEVVHHINGNKTDNRPDNLQVMTASEHKKLHTKDNINK